MSIKFLNAYSENPGIFRNIHMGNAWIIVSGHPDPRDNSLELSFIYNSVVYAMFTCCCIVEFFNAYICDNRYIRECIG